MAALDDLNLLRTFVRIAEAGSISAAARSLHTTQPTLSRQLKQLESFLDAPLVQRDSHSMSLTAAGQRLLVDAREILDHVHAATQRAHGEHIAPRGHLRVVTTIDMGQYHVAPLLAQLREQCPQLTAEMHVTNRPVKFVEEGFDCGVLVGAITDDRLVAKRLLENPRVLVAAPALVTRLGLPNKPGDLKAWPPKARCNFFCPIGEFRPWRFTPSIPPHLMCRRRCALSWTCVCGKCREDSTKSDEAHAAV